MPRFLAALAADDAGILEVNFGRADREWLERDGGVELMAALRLNSTVTSLSIAEKGLAPEVVQALAEVLTLPNKSSLTQLNLHNSAIRDESVALLGGVLSSGTCGLVSLDLSGNAAGRLGSEALASGLQSNTTLTSLNLKVLAHAAFREPRCPHPGSHHPPYVHTHTHTHPAQLARRRRPRYPRPVLRH